MHFTWQVPTWPLSTTIHPYIAVVFLKIKQFGQMSTTHLEHLQCSL